MVKLSKNELVHLLKKEVQHNKKLVKEMEYREIERIETAREWNEFQEKNNVGSVNSWISIEKFFRTDTRMKEFKEETSQELFRDGCYGATSHMIAAIEKLLDFYEDNKDL